MDKKDETFELLGSKLPMWQDCIRCGAKLSCRWGGLIYIQPCRDCQNTDEWQREQEEIASRPKERTMDEILSINKPTAVYEWRDKSGRPVRNLKINNKGNIIGDEPYKPLKPGK